MRWIPMWALLAGCGAPPAALEAPAPAPPTSLTPAQIAERAIPSVVLIRTPTGIGTGFAADDERIVTNLHVIFGAETATIIESGGRELTEVLVVAADPARDLVLLRVPTLTLPTLPIAADPEPRPGDRVVAIGHPLGLGNTVSDGLVSALRRLDEDLTLLQISAPIAPGSSGGPLFNDRGEVIGVATLHSRAAQSLNFGVPIRYLQPLLSATGGRHLAEFTREVAAFHGPAREVPVHDVALLNGCRPAQIETILVTLAGAIDSGAPLYNDGNHEACYRIYEGAALMLERTLGGCDGARRALGDGLARAAGLDTYTARAWAMRDAFDGLLDVIRRAVELEGATP